MKPQKDAGSRLIDAILARFSRFSLSPPTVVHNIHASCRRQVPGCRKPVSRTNSRASAGVVSGLMFARISERIDDEAPIRPISPYTRIPDCRSFNCLTASRVSHTFSSNGLAEAEYRLYRSPRLQPHGSAPSSVSALRKIGLPSFSRRLPTSAAAGERRWNRARPRRGFMTALKPTRSGTLKCPAVAVLRPASPRISLRGFIYALSGIFERHSVVNEATPASAHRRVNCRWINRLRRQLVIKNASSLLIIRTPRVGRVVAHSETEDSFDVGRCQSAMVGISRACGTRTSR